ncbi:cold-shock protein [Rhodococcus sp. MSC1_016]|jgi:cold shock CspA family protein|uniref:cold-shock protein n=1 Tax=Rhodococcus sp. MSC1_016 TaxID=2909266 RepID=UPI00202F2FA1|nr:cold shock domain-containing protein [Rhodococcus sp. MSC1_016]
MATTGVVRSWDFGRMQGIIDSDETPGGCWTLFHSVAVEGFPSLREGQQVEFEWDVLDSPMMGCDFYTIRAWPVGGEPYVAPRSDSPFSTRVWITFSDGTGREMTEADFPPVPPRLHAERTTGIVRIWHAEEGWGVIDSDATPGGAWTHFSDVAGPGFRSLTPGQHVTFEPERVVSGTQDGYHHRALDVRKAE